MAANNFKFSGMNQGKNPFQVKKITTIKRDANEIYPKKGLNKVDTVPNTPIDKLFHDLQSKLDGNFHELSIDVLFDRFELEDESESVSTSEFGRRYKVMEHLLNLLIDIQKFSQQQQFEDESIIKISLHDVKLFSKVVNLIILHGIYPGLNPFNIGIPLAKRTLSSFGKTNISIDTLPKSANFSNNYQILSLIYDKFLILFQIESDVKDLLIKGTGFTDFLIISIALQTIPCFQTHNKNYEIEFNEIIVKLPPTFELYQLYTLLISTASPNYFKQFVINQLQLLPCNAPKNDGLLTLIEFVLNLREEQDIDIDKFQQVSNIILSKPKSLNTVSYFSNIGQQCYKLLMNINRPIVTSCVGFICENLWVKNPRIVQDFLLKQLWQVLNPPNNSTNEVELNNGINVLISLTKKVTNDEFMKAIILPILLPLWGYLTFLNKRQKSNEIITNILVSYFIIVSKAPDSDNTVYGLDTISKNLLFTGESWCFQFGPNGLTQISEKDQTVDQSTNNIQNFIDLLDNHVKYFVQLLDSLDEDLVNKQFIQILKRWLNENKSQTILQENPYFKLIDLRLLEAIGEKFKDSLARTPKEMLELVDGLLLIKPEEVDQDVLVLDQDEADSDDEDENDQDSNLQALSIVMELLSAILTESSDLDESNRELLTKIQKSLTQYIEKSNIKQYGQSNISKSAKSLQDRISDILEEKIKPNSQQEADRQKFNRAITSLNDPLVPIRAHGLYLLRQLVESKSSIVDLEFVINLHLTQLKDPEPFIYLNVIKGLETLIEFDQPHVLEILCSIYIDDKTDLDEKLRIGEVLLRFIQSSGELFSGKIAQLIVDSTLSIIRKPVNEDDHQSKDDRLRMSAMSILGICCNTNPIGMYDRLTDALDCAIGILQLETDKDKSIMRKSAIVLIHDLIIGSSKSDSVPFPQNYQAKTFQVLKYIVATDNDLLVREQAQTVINTIDEISKDAFDMLKDNEYELLKN